MSTLTLGRPRSSRSSSAAEGGRPCPSVAAGPVPACGADPPARRPGRPGADGVSPDGDAGGVARDRARSGALNSGAVNSGAVNSGAVNSGAVNSGAVNSGRVSAGRCQAPQTTAIRA
ncbi:hypothetical protein FXF59_18410 [Microbispora tritici]|uniref:Uncharacterized protein n=2 Tax=Microbispora TaxID=2005 RepID=A0ABY3LX75_9ACTN|nr:hypothetical protein FED44_06375 [Microbispora fusca]TYB57567.1 hypothetical protein FXF59_18410 [Microbispora tritici]